MTVKQLISILLDMPMEANVLVSEQLFDEEPVMDADWCTKEVDNVVDYEDGQIGILACGKRVDYCEETEIEPEKWSERYYVGTTIGDFGGIESTIFHMKIHPTLVSTYDDFYAAAKASVEEYCQTDEGKKFYEGNCESFTWDDFVIVPNSICKKYGIYKKYVGYADETFLNDEILM